MKAMIFAAGLGTRLYPITKDKPKALAPFKDSTLLKHNLNNLANQGITKFVINTHHFADIIEKYLISNNNFGLDIQLSYEKELLDTAGGLAFASKYFGANEDVLLYNVDVISNIDINKMLTFHLEQKSKATLAVRDRETSRYLLFNKNRELIGWRNKNTGEEIWCKDDIVSNEFAFSGVHWINMSIVKSIKIEKSSIIPFYLKAGKTQKITAYQHDNDYWFDCGKPETLLLAHNKV